MSANSTVHDFITEQCIKVDNCVIPDKDKKVTNITMREHERIQKLTYLQGFRDGVAFMSI